MSTKSEKITPIELVKMSTPNIRVTLSKDVRGRDIMCISTDSKYADYILLDYIESINRCGSIVALKAPKGTFFGDKKLKINFMNSVIQTENEAFCC